MSLSISKEHYLEFSSSAVECATNITLTNPHDSIVLFKIRTTAPKSYTVKPAHGEIAPKGSIDVQIDFHPPSSTKDKFLIMSTRSKQWDDNATHEHKLRVKFKDEENSPSQVTEIIPQSSKNPAVIATAPSSQNIKPNPAISLVTPVSTTSSVATAGSSSVAKPSTNVVSRANAPNEVKSNSPTKIVTEKSTKRNSDGNISEDKRIYN
eukprot:NODE_260_length_12610_cov_0.413076.p6 type:complete len:208 gc:universal NODE_260_length_12610_cov_0.413076:9333-8710(-)